MLWGLAGPGELKRQRRLRTLGLGRAVRAFNEMAVPGLGGVWQGKHLFLSLLGVKVARHERLRGTAVTTTVVANAIEALGCSYGWSSRGGKPGPDPRLRGYRKLAGKRDLAFRKVRAPGFYVAQPMRMSVGQALPPLGLVSSTSIRFNTFSCTPQGDALIQAQTEALGQSADSVVRDLVDWVLGADCDCAYLRRLLSPLEPMGKQASVLLEHCLRTGIAGASPEAARRAQALDWMERLRQEGNAGFIWDEQPAGIDTQHWSDLQAGAFFSRLRSGAIAVLEAIEEQIATLERPRLDPARELPVPVLVALEELRHAAGAYLEMHARREVMRDHFWNAHAEAMEDAFRFGQLCQEKNSVRLLTALVQRDMTVLELRSGQVVLNSAMRTHVPAAQTLEHMSTPPEDTPSEDGGSAPAWPEGLSRRIHNLFLLNSDLRGDYSNWQEMAEIYGEER